MTSPDGPSGDASARDDSPIADAGVQRAVQHLLRTDPVEIDPERREAAIAAALAAAPIDAADPASAADPAAPTDRSTRSSAARRFLQPALAAAAVVVLVLGVVAVLRPLGSDSDDLATSDNAASDGIVTDEAGDDSLATAGDPSAARERAEAERALTGAEELAALTDLGAHPDLPALFAAAQDALDAYSGPTAGSAGRPPDLPISLPSPAEDAVQDEAAACAQHLRAAGMEIVARATLDGEEVLVGTHREAEAIVWRVDGCVELDRR